MAVLDTIEIGGASYDIKDKQAYVKPASGIPASDIASGVIPDVSQFITKSVDDLVNYYSKSDTYTQDEVRALIAAINHFHYEVYASLEAITSPANNVLYLIGPTGSGSDKYEEYVYSNNNFVKIGDTSIDLSGYVTTSALNTALADYTTTANLTMLLGNKVDRVIVKSVGATAPSSPSAGDKWYKTTDNKIYSYDGSSWDSGVAATTGATIVNSVTNDVYVFDGLKLDNYAQDISQLGQEVNGLDFTIISGKYIKPDGTIGTSYNGFYTNAFLLHEGETITYSISGNTCAILSTFANGTFTPVVVASGAQQYKNQTYTAESDVYVVFSGTPGTLTAYCSISRIDENEKAIDERTLSDKQLTVGQLVNGQISVVGNWTLSTQYQSIIYPIIPGKKYVVKGNNFGGHIAILSSTTVPTQTGQSVDYSMFLGGQNRFVVNPNEEYEFVAPADAAGLYVRLKYSTGADSCVAYVKRPINEYLEGNTYNNKIDLIAGAFVASTGALYNATGDAIFKNFVSERFLAVNKDDILLSISGLLTGESYYIAQYDADFNYLGYVSNTLPELNSLCCYIRVALSMTSAYTCTKRDVTLTTLGAHQPALVYTSIPSNASSRWVFTVYEVKNAPNVEYSSTPTTSFVGETQRIYSKGYIVLPDNYDPAGKPFPVILNCHGTNQLSFNNNALNYNIPYIEFLAKCGYAVIGCYSQTSLYSSERDLNLPSSITMSAYQSLWDYMTRLFNLDKTGAYVFGYSAGGAETVLLSQLKTIPIKCAASLAGTMDAICNLRIINSSSEITSQFTKFGLSWTGTMPSGMSTLGRMKVIDSDIKEYLMAHLDNIKPYNAITFNSTLDYTAFENRFMSVNADTPTLEDDDTLNALIDASKVYLNAPMKIWHAIDDINVPLQLSRWYAKMVMNGGGICFLREFPSGCGAHYAVGNTDHLDVNTPMVDYVTPFGETINVPVAYAEMVEWFRKW